MTSDEQTRAKVRNAFVLRPDDVEHVKLYTVPNSLITFRTSRAGPFGAQSLLHSEVVFP
jgi:hypothetical protein